MASKSDRAATREEWDALPDVATMEDWDALPDVVGDKEKSIAQLMQDVTQEGGDVSALQALGRGVKQGATLGFGDEATAGVDAGLQGLKNLYDRYIKAKKGQPETTAAQAYEESLGGERGLLSQAEEQQPGAFMAGDVLGSLALPVPGGLAAKGASKLKAGLVTGGAAGGLEAAGRTENDLLSKEGARDLAIGTGLGAGLGGALGGVAGALSGRSARKAERLARESDQAALRTIGATPSDFSKDFAVKASSRPGPDQAKGIGRTLLDEDVLKLRQNEDAVSRAINSKLDEVYETRLAPLLEEVDIAVSALPSDKTGNMWFNLQESLKRDFDDVKAREYISLTQSPQLKEKAAMVRGEVMNILTSDPANKRISTAIKLRQNINKMINETDWEKSDTPEAQTFYKGIYRNINGYINEITEEADPLLSRKFKDANRAYSNLSSATEIAAEDAAKVAADNTISLRRAVGAGTRAAIDKSPEKLLSYRSAIGKGRKAKELPNLYGGRTSTRAIRVGSAVKDDEPHLNQQRAVQYINKAEPEDIMQLSSAVRSKYGADGEHLAMALERISERDKTGRQALMFSILQRPEYRKMLGISKGEAR